MVQIAHEVQSSLTSKQSSDLDFMVNLLEGWTGLVDEESVPATVYSFTLMQVHKSLFHKYAPDDAEDRISFTDGYLYNEFIITLLKSIAAEGSASKYNKVCDMAYPDYKGGNVCAYNIARSFGEAK